MHPGLQQLLQYTAVPACGTPSAGLDVTPMGLALAAVVALDEAGRLGPAGVTTPAAAFQGTSYWPRLVEW